MAIGTAIVGGTTITSIIRTIQDSVCGQAAAWSGLSGWGDYGWTDPIYYSYGDNVYYDDGSVNYGDQPVCTEQQYIDQAEAIVLSVPDVKPAEKDWMPLGVFAITQDGEPTGAEPTMFLSSALSKQGVINGTFQNTATNTVKAVEGMVDKQTRRSVDRGRRVATAYGSWDCESNARFDCGAGSLSRQHDSASPACQVGTAWRREKTIVSQTTPCGICRSLPHLSNYVGLPMLVDLRLATAELSDDDVSKLMSSNNVRSNVKS